MRIFFGLIGIGLVFAAISGAAVSWDGSVYLINILDTHTPFVPHDRYINVLLHLPVLLLSNVTSNVAVLQAVFGLTYAAIPVLSLALCWWIARPQVRTLFVWAALGIGLGILPGLFNMVAEAHISIFLFWPMLFVLLTGIQRQHVPVIIALMLAVFISHPNAAVLFAFAAGTAFVIGAREPAERRKLWFWASSFVVLAFLTLLRLWLRGRAYERDQLTLGTFGWTFSVSLAGLPLLAILAAGIAAFCIFAVPFGERRNERLARMLPSIATFCIIGSGFILLLWASNPQQWTWANKFTLWAPFISLFFMSIAVIERLTTRPALLDRDEANWLHRTRMTQLVAGVFLVTLATQSAAWLGLTTRLRDTLASSPWNCVSMAPVEWIQQTPLGQFGTPALSLLLQGKQPMKVMLAGDNCGTQDFRAGLSLDQYSTRDWNTGWFDMRVLNERLVGEQNIARGCSFTLTSGWHQTERDGPYWWRWSDGKDAQIKVLAEKPINVALTGQVESAEQPNEVYVFVNGEQQQSLNITWDGLQTVSLVPLRLEAGSNVIRFVSRTEATQVQGRMLALSVANLVMTTGDTAVSCTWHP